MSALHHVPPVLARATTASALTLAAFGTTLILPAPASAAGEPPPGAKALHVAAAKEGAPYSYGATGPHSFDCSGLTQYAFKRVGKELPRTAQQQFDDSRQVPADERRVGDLVFFHYGNSVYHVGLYAGHDRIWHAPRTGSVVRREKIWTSAVWYGRVN